MTMTPRETVLNAFSMKPTERVPVTLFGGGMWSIKDFGTSFEELSGNVEKNVEMCVTEAEKIRSDIVYAGSGFNNFHAIALGRKHGVDVKFREIGAPDMTSHIVNSEEDLAKLDMEDIFREPVISQGRAQLSATTLYRAVHGTVVPRLSAAVQGIVSV